MKPRRYQITDFEWSVIALLLPNKPRGVPRANDRKVLNGIFWRPLAEDRLLGPPVRHRLARLRR